MGPIGLICWIYFRLGHKKSGSIDPLFRGYGRFWFYCQPPTMAKISRSPIGTGTAATGFSWMRKSAMSL